MNNKGEQVTEVKDNTGVHKFLCMHKKIYYTVKKEFLEKIPDPSIVPPGELATKHNMMNFLHNEHGPAIHSTVQGYQEYWLNGKRCSEEDAERIKHNIKFNNEFNELLK